MHNDIFIVCAANKHKDKELIIPGVRHGDKLMTDIMKLLGLKKFWIQGFMDNRRNFHTREEAWKIAKAAGQIYRRVGGDCANGGTLYSENLY